MRNQTIKSIIGDKFTEVVRDKETGKVSIMSPRSVSGDKINQLAKSLGDLILVSSYARYEGGTWIILEFQR